MSSYRLFQPNPTYSQLCDVTINREYHRESMETRISIARDLVSAPKLIRAPHVINIELHS